VQPSRFWASSTDCDDIGRRTALYSFAAVLSQIQDLLEEKRSSVPQLSAMNR
jgi:hypothetical protein